MSSTIVVAGLILKSKNLFLLARRSGNRHLSGYWEFPGGKVEKNEEEVDCLKRELLEELGIDVNVKKFFMLNQHDYSQKKILLKSYFCELEGLENFCFNYHDRIEWVRTEDLLDYKLAPADIPIAKALNDRNYI